ncbi:hypothetical protein BPAE_0026g00050 [Botrytis paeoniae]|uniref:Uncharacterized protein n=1 Tax=Botrytis paeoniae TaxID=278948 RepID=A0A4Z1G369_9HELO|nr:hypothetical protein BPAE_0026g00050 [Botrytis paeoniae]
MAKSQATKGASKVPNKVLYSRISYLYQAATYLAVQGKESQEQSTKGTVLDSSMEDVMKDESQAVANVTEGPHQALSRRLITDLRSVSLKGLMRISPGTTCTAKVENQSKGGKKPWADVLVRKCHTCGLEKRFPLATERQPRRPRRFIQEAKTSAA